MTLTITHIRERYWSDLWERGPSSGRAIRTWISLINSYHRTPGKTFTDLKKKKMWWMELNAVIEELLSSTSMQVGSGLCLSMREESDGLVEISHFIQKTHSCLGRKSTCSGWAHTHQLQLLAESFREKWKSLLDVQIPQGDSFSP